MIVQQTKIFEFTKEEALEILRDYIIKNTKEGFDICPDQSTELVAIDSSAYNRLEVYYDILSVEIKA